MEKQEKHFMILTIEENMQMCDWLIQKGLCLAECATVLVNIECGNTFAFALSKVFIERTKKMEEMDEEFDSFDWGSPITL